MAEQVAETQESKKPKMVEKDYDEEARSVSFTFSDGYELEIKLDELPAEMHTRLALHGLIQKGGDSYAGVKDVNEAKASVQKVIDQLKAGAWRAAGEGEGKPRIGELAQAIATVVGKPIEEVTGIVAAADDAKRKGWRANPAVLAAIAELRAKKAREAAAKAGEVTLTL